MKTKRIEATMCFLPFILVFVCEPFSILFEGKKEKVLCPIPPPPTKSILGLILIKLKRCKKS